MELVCIGVQITGPIIGAPKKNTLGLLPNPTLASCQVVDVAPLRKAWGRGPWDLGVLLTASRGHTVDDRTPA